LKRDAHYYATLALCRACGFNKESAYLIAYASQFVDDAKINLMFIDNPKAEIEYNIVDNQPAFTDMATCHTYFWLKALNCKEMEKNTCAFHFVPGCGGNNPTQKLRCKEESPLILDILNDVLLEDDLIKLGIVLHAYADTFSHQGFGGFIDKINYIKNCKAKTEGYLGLVDSIVYLFEYFSQYEDESLLNRIVPAYGHGQAMDFPDIPYLEWSYEYDESEDSSGCYKEVDVNNKVRFKRAFRGIEKYLKMYLLKHGKYADSNNQEFERFDMFIETLLLEKTDKTREEKWKALLIEQNLFRIYELDLIVYDENKWLEQAFVNFDPLLFYNWKVEGVQLAEDFLDSCWYQFYLAVKWYKQKFFGYCIKYQLCFPD